MIKYAVLRALSTIENVVVFFLQNYNLFDVN